MNAPSQVLQTRAQRQRSLFGEILDWMLVPLLLVWPLAIGITYLVAQAIATQPYDRLLQARVEQLAEQLRTRPALALAQLRQDHGSQAQALLQLRTHDDGHVEGDPDIGVPPDADWPRNDGTHLRTENHAGHQLRVAWRWLPPQREAGGWVLLQAAEGTGQRQQLARAIVRGVILPQFVIVPISILLVWFGLGQGIVPLDALQASIRRRRPDDLSPIDPSQTPEEIGPLVDSINGLLGRLEQSIHTHKRFIADAAHQLKTPLAGLRMQAELAQRQSDPRELRASLKQIGLSVVRTTRLVNQLLALARAENQRVSAADAHTLLDLREPVREALQELATLALDKGQELEFDAPETPLWLRGNALLLQELTKNLLDNAIAYTPRGGRVRVRLRRLGRNLVELAVDDSGVGIPPAERELVLQPFYRVLGTGQDGSGLGLSIVQEIARQHDVELSLDDNPDCAGGPRPGLRVRLRFAAAAAPQKPDSTVQAMDPRLLA